MEGGAVAQKPIIASIIIPMMNEERFIGRCLETILSNDFPIEQCEILVLDGRSKDRSRKIVEEKAVKFPSIRLLDNPLGSVPTAMNIGIRAAKGEYILRVDAHSEYPPNYIRTCLEELARTGADNVGGRWITKAGAESLVARAIALTTQHPLGVGNAAYRLGRGDCFVDTVPFGSYRRELFERIGPYREDLVRNQDYELNCRIRKAGGKIYLSSKINIVYFNVPTFSRFMRQAFNNGIYVAHMWFLNPASFCWRHGAPLLFVVGLLAGLGLSVFSTSFQTILVLVLALYFLTTLLASMQIAVRRGIKFLPVLPGLFLSYHLVYGAGTIVGLARYPFAKKAKVANVSALREI